MSESTETPAPRVWWKRKGVRRILSTLIVCAVGVLFAVALVRNWQQVREQNLTPDWRWALAVVLFAIAVPLTGLLWRRMLLHLQPDAQVSRSEAVSVQCASWLLKYIPGQVGSTVNKVIWAGRKGISRAVVIITVIYENVFLQVCSIAPGAAVVVAALGPELFGDQPFVLGLPVLALIPLALVLWRPAFHRAVDLVARKALGRAVPQEYFLGLPTTLKMLLGFTIPRVVNAAGFVLLATSVTDVAPSEWAVFGAAYVLAGAIGILAVLVPSGLGVREAVIVAVLAPYVGVAAAIVLSILARACSTVGDALIAMIYLITRPSIAKEPQR